MPVTTWFSGEEDVVGLDMSDGLLTVARVRVGHDGTVRLCNAGWVEIPAGVSEREQAAAIRRLWRQSGMPSSTVCASFRGRSGTVRYFKYPALKREELESALRLEAEETLQLPPAEIVMDWHLNPAGSAESSVTGSRPYEGLLVAAPRKDVDQFLALLRMAGLYPVMLDLDAAAVGNLFCALHPDPKGLQEVCLVHLTRQCADIAVIFEQRGLYARTVYARGKDWDASLDLLAEGIKEALKYFEFKLRRSPPGKIVLAGRLPTRSGADAWLQTATGIPVEVWDPLQRVVPASFRVKRLLARPGGLPSLAIAMGLALRRYDDA